MDPVSIATVATVASTAIGAYATYSAQEASANRMESEAKAKSAAAAVEAQWADRRKNEEIAAAQHNASETIRQKNLAQSALIARAGANGGNADDPTVMDLWKDIEVRGRNNADRELIAGETRGQGINFQGDLGLWRSQAEGQIAQTAAGAARTGAELTALGGAFGTVGSGTKTYYDMSSKYGGPSSNSASTGYGYR